MSPTEAPLTATISADTREKLDRFAEESGVERDEVVERALRWYIRGATADGQRDLEAAAKAMAHRMATSGVGAERRRVTVAALRAKLAERGTRLTHLDPVDVVREDRDR